MPISSNPFLERMSERTKSDHEFVTLFSPKILDKLAEDAFEGAVHIFRSPPGGGKTTLLRAFTPTALRAFWNARHVQEMNESYQRLTNRKIINEIDGPQLLGVLLSCASGYADLPSGAAINRDGLFRALLDCRVVLRSLRNVALLIGYNTLDNLDSVTLEYDDIGKDLKSIPILLSAGDLLKWAEQQEREVYTALDYVADESLIVKLAHVRFESVLWLQSVRFIFKGRIIAPKRLLMIDDLHKLRKNQRLLLIQELTDMRPIIPVWLAERNIVLGEELLAQGIRQDRELKQYALEEMWRSRGQSQFVAYATNILDRRLSMQTQIPLSPFATFLRETLQPDDVMDQVLKGIEKIKLEIERHRTNPRYSEWIRLTEQSLSILSVETLRNAYTTRILLARDEGKVQLSLDLMPLSKEDYNNRDNSQVQGASEIFLNNDFKIPYFYGIDRLCVLATNNIEELLNLAAALYEELIAKQILGKPDIVLSPHEQEKMIKEVAKKKRNFIPKNHTEGTRAQRLIDAIGNFCREKTFLINAPYAPGVTGIRLSQSEMIKLNQKSTPLAEQYSILNKVLYECVAENLFVSHQSSASTSRECGNIFYLNRTLCAYYGLPLQMGGWQDVSVKDLIEWMEHGRMQKKLNILDTN